MPSKFQESIFKKLFEIAEIAQYDEQERQNYQDSLKYYWDLKNVMDTAVEEALENNKREIAKNLIELGLDNELIMKATHLKLNEIETLHKK